MPGPAHRGFPRRPAVRMMTRQRITRRPIVAATRIPMSPKFTHLAAACGLAVLLPTGALAACAGASPWSDLGPPAFGGFREALEAGGDAADCAAPALPADAGVPLDIHLTDLSLYQGMRFLTWDAAPSPITLRLPAALPEADLPAPAVRLRADGSPEPEAVALFLAGFLGIGLVALRKKRP